MKNPEIKLTSRQRMEKFLKALENSGVHVKTNWQKELTMPNGHVYGLDHCSVYKDGNWCMVLIQVYPDGNGYDVFVQSKDNDIEGTINTIIENLKI